jgi:colicin import membrane protein
MIRQREKEVVWQAGAFTLAVHGLLLALLLVSFQWKTIKPMNVAEVELWDAVPTPAVHAEVTPPEPPAPTPEPPKVVEPVKAEPAKIEPAKIELKPEPAPEPKADIQVKKEPIKPPVIEKPKPVKEEKPKVEKVKEEPKPEKKVDPDALKKLQQALLAEDAKTDKAEVAKPAASPNGDKNAQKPQAGVPNPGEMAKYMGLISGKIRQHVNRQLCGTDRTTKLSFMIALMPTGEVMGHPKLLKSSGMSACDDAVERAILESQPLPVPTSADLFSQFRDLKLEFSPNADN